MAGKTTPPKMTQILKGLCYDLNSDNPLLWVKVVPENWALMNECFPNVQKKIAKDGGSFVNGWVLWQSGSSKACVFPEKPLLEIQKVKADITQKVPHNAPCPCGFGLKYKNCCGPYESL